MSPPCRRIDAGLDGPLRIGILRQWSASRRGNSTSGCARSSALGTGQYVSRARIERACTLLKGDEEPISGVALACGYGDQAAFTRAFRRAVGLTPSAYRASFPSPGRSKP